MFEHSFYPLQGGVHLKKNNVEQMILSKNNKQTNKKQKQIMGKKSRLGVPKGERRGSGADGHFGGFLDASC